jgi:Spy/CpxP family protein refolding chaperone
MLVADEIGLTDAQKDELEQLRTDFQLAQIDRRAELRKAEVKLRDLMNDDDASAAVVNRAIDEVAALKAELQKARYAHRQQVESILTAEQLEKLEQLRQERFEERRQGRGGKTGRGQGRGWGNP